MNLWTILICSGLHKHKSMKPGWAHAWNFSPQEIRQEGESVKTVSIYIERACLQQNKWSSQALCSCPPACCTADPPNSSAVLPMRRIKTQPSPCWAHHQWERPVNEFQNNARRALPVLWEEETNFVRGCWRKDGTFLQLWRNEREFLEKAVERTAWGGGTNQPKSCAAVWNPWSHMSAVSVTNTAH